MDLVYDNIIEAKFLHRPNRFIAEVEIEGQKEIVHVKNTGRCKELLVPGCAVWLTPILPFINDTEENIKAILDECIRVGQAFPGDESFSYLTEFPEKYTQMSLFD